MLEDPFSLFLAALVFFHLSEFLLAALYNRKELSWSSFLFSKPYCIAMGAACVEHFLEKQWLPSIKAVQAASWIGLAAVIFGEALRKAAMVTAKHNFTHLIQYSRREEHQLVVHGVYRWVRHPGYAGWFVWAVGTQLLLCNPICTMAFAVVVWVFFKRRIAVEERLLVQFFGPEYQHYQAGVPSGLPLIS